MSRIVGLLVNETGVGMIEFHDSFENQIDRILGGCGLDSSIPLRAGFGGSRTMSMKTWPHNEPNTDAGERLRRELEAQGFEVGVM